MADDSTPARASAGQELKAAQGIWRSLRYRDYRYLWFGGVGHAAALWMEQVIRPLLILELTGSALQVGNIVAARTLPQLAFGIVAGAVADRYNKRLVLIVSESITMLTQLVLGLLLVTGTIEIWHIYATALITGASNAFRQPARQSMVPRLVPREDMLNALALNSAAGNLMRVAGAGLAGVLLIAFDFGQVYLLSAALEVAVLSTVFMIRLPAMDSPDGPAMVSGRHQRGRRSGFLLRDLVEGFRYIRRNNRVLYLVAAALILFVFAQPYQQVFVPLIGRDVLHVDRSVVGLMLAVTGVGALVGSLTVASRSRIRHRGAIMMGALILEGLALVLFAHSHLLWLSIGALLFTGLASVVYISLNNALLLEIAEPEFHGRVLSFMSLDRGLMSAGSVLGGALAEGYGASLGLTAMAAACVALAVITLLFVPPVRHMS